MSHISHFLSASGRGQCDCCCRSGWPGARTLPSSPTSNRLERGENTEHGAGAQSPVPVPTPAILSSHTRFDPSQLPYFKYRQAMAQLAANSTQVRQVNISYLWFVAYNVYGHFNYLTNQNLVSPLEA